MTSVPLDEIFMFDEFMADWILLHAGFHPDIFFQGS